MSRDFEPLDWSYFEKRCKKAKLSVRFSKSLCDQRSATSTVAFFIQVSSKLRSKLATASELQTLGVCRFRTSRCSKSSFHNSPIWPIIKRFPIIETIFAFTFSNAQIAVLSNGRSLGWRCTAVSVRADKTTDKIIRAANKCLSNKKF